jgi:hypothetical protein
MYEILPAKVDRTVRESVEMIAYGTQSLAKLAFHWARQSVFTDMTVMCIATELEAMRSRRKAPVCPRHPPVYNTGRFAEDLSVPLRGLTQMAWFSAGVRTR